jgi:3-hydroxyisobutyrate dehydrogenase-like beta-hydroxyacid dehydrogenase
VREHGGVAAASPAELAQRSDVVITMVVDSPDVEQVLLGPAGVVEGAKPGLLCIDMSTIAPSASRRIAGTLAERGLRFVDAPVTGSAPRAQDGTLTIMVGGNDEGVAAARPLLEAMGKLIVHVGPVGQGEMAKVINNAVAATNAAVIAQALTVAERTGVDTEALVQVMAAGSGASTMLDLKADPMRRHDYTPLFKLAHMLKDVRICLEEVGRAESNGAGFPFAEQTAELLAQALEQGHGDDDFAAVVEVVERRAGIRLGERTTEKSLE